MNLQHAMDIAPDSIIALDRAGNVAYWNQGSTEIFGFTSEEMLGNNLDAIIPEKLRQRHNEAYAVYVETGKSRYGPGHMLAVPAMNKAGERISVEFRLSILTDEEGKVEYVVSILRDVTERWNKEQETRRRLMELEKQLKEK